MTDQQLIADSLKNDHRAQRVLFDRYTSTLFQVSMRYSSTKMDAEDALQEAWINIFKGLEKYNEQGKLLAWMKKITIHCALRKRQSSWFTTEEIGLDYKSIPKFNPQAIDQMSADEILGYVLNLPPGYKEVFTLFVIEGYSHKEIGEFLGIEASTSRAKLTTARKHMRNSVLEANKIYSNVS